MAIVKALKREKGNYHPNNGSKKVALSGQYLQLETKQKLNDEGVLTLSKLEQQKQHIMYMYPVLYKLASLTHG